MKKKKKDVKIYKWSDKQKKEARLLLEKYKNRLNLHGWQICLYFENGQVDEAVDATGSTYVTSGIVAVTTEYEKAKIVLKPSILEEIIENGDKDILASTIKHELAHCITQEILDVAVSRYVTQKQCLDAVERLTQRISVLI
jgi:hypothetical protein